jgi:hypothetical protein
LKAENCPSHTLIRAIARIKNDPDYQVYRHVWKIRKMVQKFFETTGIELKNGGGSLN